MKNTGFILAVAAALGAGTLIGWYAIPALSPMVLQPSEASTVEAETSGPAREPTIVDSLRFSIDTTRPAGDSDGSPYRPSNSSQDAPLSLIHI